MLPFFLPFFLVFLSPAWTSDLTADELLLLGMIKVMLFISFMLTNVVSDLLKVWSENKKNFYLGQWINNRK